MGIKVIQITILAIAFMPFIFVGWFAVKHPYGVENTGGILSRECASTFIEALGIYLLAMFFCSVQIGILGL